MLLSAAFYAIKLSLPEYSLNLLMSANGLMALLSIITYYMVSIQIKKKPEAFVRGVYAATFMKLMVCMFSLLTYVLVYRDHLHKPSLFILFGIYAVYTTVETWLLTKMAKDYK